MKQRLSIYWVACGVAAATLAAAGGGPLTFVVGVTPADQKPEAAVVARDPASTRTANRIAIIDVQGMLINAKRRGLLSQRENPVAELSEKLKLAADDADVKAVILRINTAGGAVTASDIMYREIRRFREETGKPVVALMMDMATSGGYYVSLSADRIVAHPTTVTGSVGVILQVVSLQPALQNIGVTADAITSGANKAAGNPLAPFTPAQRQTLQTLVDDFYQRFRDLVRDRRPDIDPQQFDTITDGRVFSGDQAHALKLVDELGDLHTAWAEAKSLAGVEAANLVLYHSPLAYVASPYAAAPTHVEMNDADEAGEMNLLQLNLGASGASGAAGDMGLPAAFLYLWRPGL